MPIPNPEIEVLLPVHNEGGSIARVVREIYGELSPSVAMQFIICEDGSVDDTKEVLARLGQTMPMQLITSKERKGYSRAVINGMELLKAPYLVCLDSDGQCDPKDFWKFWDLREGHDVVIGRRIKRQDSLLRRITSRVFFLVYQALYRVPVRDPSCPFVLINRKVVCALLGELGEMKEGFWWEFVARAHKRGFSIEEVPVNHRVRLGGTTQVYKPNRLPIIGYRHFVALFKILLQMRNRPTSLPQGRTSRPRIET